MADDIDLKKLIAKMPEDWRKKLRQGLKKVRAKDPGLGMILKAEVEKLGKEIEAKKKSASPKLKVVHPPASERKKSR